MTEAVRVLGTAGMALYFEEVRFRKVIRIVEIRMYPCGVPASLPNTGDIIWLQNEEFPFRVLGRVWAYSGDQHQVADGFVSIYVRPQRAAPLRLLRSWFRGLSDLFRGRTNERPDSR